MDKIYQPSIRKVAIHNYLYPTLHALGIMAIAFVYTYIRNNTIMPKDFETHLIPIIVLPFFLLFRFYIDSFTVKLLAITLTNNSILGPVHKGRKIPIPFSEMDFEKTFKTKKFCSIHGDEMEFEEKFFEPEDVNEIWETIKRHEGHQKKTKLLKD